MLLRSGSEILTAYGTLTPESRQRALLKELSADATAPAATLEEIAWVDALHQRCREQITDELLEAAAVKGRSGAAGAQADAKAAKEWLLSATEPLCGGDAPVKAATEPLCAGDTPVKASAVSAVAVATVALVAAAVVRASLLKRSG